MTMPNERFNAIEYARQFLRDLLDPSKTPRVPRAIRREAYYRLKHFPRDSDMEYAREAAPEVWGQSTKKRGKKI